MTGALAGKVVLVTGASRGLGRAAALEFAQAGARVICTARSTRGHSTQDRLPNATIDDTLDAIRAVGGQGEAVACDHTDESQVRMLLESIAARHGQLDVLVNNAWGGHDPVEGTPHRPVVWDEPPGQLRNMLLAGDYVTSLPALKHLMAPAGRGVILSTTWHTDEPPGWLPYEISKAAKNRLVYALGTQMRGQGIAVVGVAPGWMHTELMELYHTPEELAGQTETPHYAARALVALACDPDVLRHTGQVLDVGKLARLYGFTDLDGRQPDWNAQRRMQGD